MTAPSAAGSAMQRDAHGPSHGAHGAHRASPFVCVRPTDAAEFEPVVMQNPSEAMGWVTLAIGRASRVVPAATLRRQLTRRTITTSSSFTGVGTDVTATNFITGQVKNWIAGWDASDACDTPITFQSL